ncbi:MAG: hypothetical protein KatS3mg109_2034 [Pirellulaceae bacterium]|nr:MAG: hypothetical protein KatS3mg109_2034 [Pirellulaceae bacterium]
MSARYQLRCRGGKWLALKEEHAGRVVTCPVCGTKMRVAEAGSYRVLPINIEGQELESLEGGVGWESEGTGSHRAGCMKGPMSGACWGGWSTSPSSLPGGWTGHTGRSGWDVLRSGNVGVTGNGVSRSRALSAIEGRLRHQRGWCDMWCVRYDRAEAEQSRVCGAPGRRARSSLNWPAKCTTELSSHVQHRQSPANFIHWGVQLPGGQT